MKRSLLILLALLLVLGSASYAEENTEKAAGKAPDLFDIWDYNGESMTWLCSATPVTEGIVMAPASALPDSAEHLVLSDGQSLWEIQAMLPDETGSIAMMVYDAEKTPARYGAWALMPLGGSTDASTCTVRFGDALGSRINRAVLYAEEITWSGQRCYLLTLSDEAPVGSPVLSAAGELAGMIVSEYAEGKNRYVVLPSDGVASTLNTLSALMLNMSMSGQAPEGLAVIQEKNLVTVNWKDMALPEKAEGEEIYLVIYDVGNSYLNYFTAETDNRSISVVLTPGRTYLFGIGAFRSAPDTVPQPYATCTIPAAKQLTEYSFHSETCAIAVSEGEKLADGEKPVPVAAEEITEELLRSGRSWFYSWSTYEVTETISDRTLLVTLTDPNDVNYRYESGWVYDPGFMKEDIWYVSMNETGLTGRLDISGYPKGVYEIAFYVDGDLADSFTFELK